MSDGPGGARIGVDIGGTFTDVAAVDEGGALRIGKRLTTHGSEEVGVLEAVTDTAVGLTDPGAILAHGTTLVINALLERKGARVALVTTAGFEDVLDLARGNRPEPFNYRYRRDPPLIPRELRFGVAERTHASGEVTTTPSDDDLNRLVATLQEAGVDAIAVGFVNAYLAPDNERLVRDALRDAFPGVRVVISSDVSRQPREYERFTTAVANAYVAPVARAYLNTLEESFHARGFRGQFVVLDSSGGAMSLSTASALPVRAVESGPVAGVIGARKLAEQLGIENMVTFDMGGTTAKTAFLESGRYATTDVYWIGGYNRGIPLQVNTVDIVEVGAGGGSLGWVDAAGRLRVGPRSAGSVPGPACYGLGGTEPTVTDANLYCGRLDPANFVGSLTLDVDAATVAITELAERVKLSPTRLALGILRLANIRMAAAVRRQTLERGRDPRHFTLLATGGAGPLHACEVAADVGIRSVLIPLFPGHFSAMGMLDANLRLDRLEVLTGPLSEINIAQLGETFERIGGELEAQLNAGQAETRDPVARRYALALRYVGQEHTILIPARMQSVHEEWLDEFKHDFEEEYVRRYGHLDESSYIEVVELEVVVERELRHIDIVAAEPIGGVERRELTSYFALDERPVTSTVIPRSTLSVGDRFSGPAVMFEEGATSVIPPGAHATVLEGGYVLVALP
jgi:N-methylhydantoinase A